MDPQEIQETDDVHDPLAADDFDLEEDRDADEAGLAEALGRVQFTRDLVHLLCLATISLEFFWPIPLLQETVRRS